MCDLLKMVGVDIRDSGNRGGWRRNCRLGVVRAEARLDLFSVGDGDCLDSSVHPPVILVSNSPDSGRAVAPACLDRWHGFHHSR